MFLASVFKRLLHLAKSSLSIKLFLLYVVTITIPVIAFSLISYSESSKVIEKNFIAYQVSLNHQLIEAIDRKLDILLSQSISTYYLLENVQYALKEPAYQYSDRYFEVYARINSYALSIVQGNKNINGITLIDVEGNVKYHLDSRSNVASSSSFKEASWLIAAIDLKGSPYFRGPHIRDYVSADPGTANAETISLSRAIKSQDNQSILGVIIFEVDADVFWNDIRGFELETDNTISVFDNTGRIIYLNKDDKQEAMRAVYGQLGQSGPDFIKVHVQDVEFQVHSIESSITGWTLLSILPASVLHEQSHFIKNINATLLVSIVFAIFAISVFLSISLTRILKVLQRAFKSLKEGDLNIHVPVKGSDELAQIATGFNDMVKGMNLVIRDRFQADLMKKQAQLESLESQINPHFLYNTLSLVKDEVSHGNSMKSALIIQQLSDIFRYSLAKGLHFVKISEELNHAQKYLSIMHERYGGKFTVHFEIEPNILDVDIPRLTIQPIVENIIKHSFDDMTSGGIICILGKMTAWGCNLYIIDNGIGIESSRLVAMNAELGKNYETNDKINEKIGIYNVNSRLKLYFGNDYGLQLTRSIDGGTTVKISLPIRMNQEETE
jgi:two-component system sensor histidine kinase YesM